MLKRFASTLHTYPTARTSPTSLLRLTGSRPLIHIRREDPASVPQTANPSCQPTCRATSSLPSNMAFFNTSSLHDKKVFTGASGGIGKATALLFAQLDARSS